MRYSEEILEEIKSKNDLVEIVSEYVSLQRAGKNYKGLCPFHSEKTPSFTVNSDKQLFHCFGCGVGGNVYHFIMKIENLTFPEAVKFLAERAGVILPEDRENYKSNKYRERKLLYSINKKAGRYFYKNLIQSEEGKKALEYLLKRGIEPETIKIYGLGYARKDWDDLIKHLRSLGYKDSHIHKSGLAVERKSKKGYYDRFRERIMFPIFDISNNVVGFGGRVLDDSLPKYLNSPETGIFNKRLNLYGLNTAKQYCRDKGLILVEGYMDVISLYQNGIKNAVATLGTALTQEQAKLIRRYTDRVFVGYDSDEAGVKAAFRGLDILSGAGLEVRVIQFPVGFDPDDFVREKGLGAFMDLLAEALPLMDFKINVIKRGNKLDSVEDKNRFIEEVIPHLAKMQSLIKRDGYVKKISEITNIQEEAIRAELQKYIRGNLPNYREKSIKGKKWYNNKNVKKTYISGWESAEKYVLMAMIKGKHFYNMVREVLNPSDFQGEGNSQIARHIYNEYESHGKVNFSRLLNELDEDLRNRFSELAADEDYEIDEVTVQGCLQTIKKEKLTLEMKKIAEKIRECEKGNDTSDLVDLLSRYKELSSKLKSM